MSKYKYDKNIGNFLYKILPGTNYIEGKKILYSLIIVLRRKYEFKVNICDII